MKVPMDGIPSHWLDYITVIALFTGLEPGSTDTDSHPANATFCWSQMMTRDLAAAQAFYCGLMGWTASPMGPGMVLFSRGERPVATAMQMPAEAPMPDHWLSYVAVEDADASTAKAEALGAQVFHKPETMPGMGRFSVLADPQGAVFALWKDLSEAR